VLHEAHCGLSAPLSHVGPVSLLHLVLLRVCVCDVINERSNDDDDDDDDVRVRCRAGRCTSDYVDVYTQSVRPFQDLLEVPLHGRYCGDNPAQLPALLVS